MSNSLEIGAVPGAASTPEWEKTAQSLERLLEGPTERQRLVADQLGISLPADVPAQVAAAILRAAVSDALGSTYAPAEVSETLGELEDCLGLPRTTRLISGTRDELSAWFSARYALKSARGLRATRPGIGDVVASLGWDEGEHRIVSSIGEDGRVYMRHLPARRAWPDYLTVVARLGSQEYEAAAAIVEASVRNATTSRSTNFANFRDLDPYRLDQHTPSPEAIRELEDLLESGERREEPFQQLLTRNPAFLAMTVVGGWRTYVIPKARLGSEHVTDFLVLGINSVGPQWVTVELEAPRHRILTRAGRLSGATRHAIDQIQDWREWLTLHISYAQTGLGLHGITNRSPGLVIIGRDDPVADPQPARLNSGYQSRIDVHSWDWLLRHVRDVGSHRPAEFAYDNLREQSPALRAVASMGTTEAPWSFDDMLSDSEDLELG